MLKKLLEGMVLGGGILIVFSAVALIYAVGFHEPAEVVSGVFEGDYVFNGDVNVSSDLCIDGGNCLASVDSSSVNELQDLNNVLLLGNNAGAKRITNLANPANGQDAATKSYVDSNSGGGTFSYANCAWTSYASASTGNWATMTCPAGKYVAGWDCYWSKNSEENEQIRILPSSVNCRYINGGSIAYAKAYCCNIQIS